MDDAERRARKAAYMREWRAKHPDRARENARQSMRRFRAKHPERNRETKRRHYEQTRERQIAKVVQWQRDNPERARKKLALWRARNPERHAAQARKDFQRRRARQAGATGTHTILDVQSRFALHGNRCRYCGAAENLTMDHMIPLSRGGSNLPANLVPACEGCNKRKATRTYFEFVAAQAA